MPPEGTAPGSPEDWLRSGRSDLAMAEGAPRPEVLLEMVCFHAQQAVEKAIKGVLLSRSVSFPYTHNIAKLITLLTESGVPFPEELRKAARLTDYATTARYPGPWDPVTEEECRRAIALAEGALTWAQNEVRQHM